MSIIHEALKKVQANLQKQPVSEEVTVSASAPLRDAPDAPVSTKKQSGPFMTVAAVIFLVGALWFSYTQVLKYFPRIKTVQLSAFKPQPRPLAKVTATSTNAASPSDPASSTLNIQGIMQNKGATVALINNKIYEAGDEINGIKILTISTEFLTILRDGKEETIEVRH